MSSSEKPQESKKLDEEYPLLARADGYWTQFCEAMDLEGRMLSLQTHASVGQKTTLLLLLQMWQRAANVSMQRFQKLASMARQLSPSEMSPQEQSSGTRLESQLFELDLQSPPDDTPA